MSALGERALHRALAAAVYPESRALVRAHQRKGHTVAIVSSATRYQIEPLARDLGIEHVLCTRLEVEDGRFTGRRREARPATARARRDAARELAAAHGVDLDESCFYTDSDEDLPLLDIVGRPRPTNPNRALARDRARAAAGRRGASRAAARRALTEIVRTALAVGSIVPSVAARPRRRRC